MHDQSIAAFLDEVALPKNFSQSPVRMPSGDLSLITTNAVARWIAESYEPGGVAIDDATIEHVLGYAEAGDAIRMTARQLTAVQAWRIFSGENGVAPAAIAVTESGDKAEKPLALVVKIDVPELLRALGV